MAENDVGERSEAATPKKRLDSKKKGQVARSKELNTAALLIAAAFGFLTVARYSFQNITQLLSRHFDISRTDAFDPNVLISGLGYTVFNSFYELLPLLIILLLIATISPVILGGWSFSMKSAAPKLNRLSPLKGFKRMFGATAGMELIKSISKFAVVASVAITALWSSFDGYLALGKGDIQSSVVQGLESVASSFLIVTLSLLIIVAIDVPFQIWNHARQLKMTKQEVKDEMKDTEGRPEVKGRLRQAQREMANRRMMSEVPTADVVITNPEHFAVALKYDENQMQAPIVVAKGTEQIALKIREIAKAHEVPMFAAPPLARAIFYSTKLEHPIPEGLYLAVAQVLAYVFQLKAFRKGKGERPVDITDLPIPDDLKR
jgi:flagellar biosynthesis protein FlhB